MLHKRGAFSRQPSYEASKIEKPSDKRTTRNWAQRAAAVLELATGALWSTRAWYCTAGGLPLPMYRCVPILCMYIVVAFFPVPSAFSFGFRCGNVLDRTSGSSSFASSCAIVVLFGRVRVRLKITGRARGCRNWHVRPVADLANPMCVVHGHWVKRAPV